MNVKNELQKAKQGSVSEIRTMIRDPRYQNQIATILPAEIPVKKFISLASKALSDVPALAKCDANKTFSALMSIANLGAEIGQRGCYLIPHGQEPTVIITAPLLIRLALESGHVTRVDSAIVREADQFNYVLGSDPLLEHSPNLFEPGSEPIGVYAIADLKGGGLLIEVMSWQEIEEIRSRAAGKNSPAWKDYAPEMARKVVLKRLLKRCPLSSRAELAINLDHAAASGESQSNLIDDVDLPPVIEGEVSE